MNQLLSFDTDLLLAINGCHTTFLDRFLWSVSSREAWIALYIAMLITLVLSYQPSNGITTSKRSKWLSITFVIIGFAVCVGLSDYISGIIKHAVCRLRPSQEPALDTLLHIVNGYHGGKYGFVSSHAANTFSAALLFALLFRHWHTTISLMAWVVLNCWSRMYLGVHYPGDIVGGLAVGAIIALITYYIMANTLLKKGTFSQPKSPYLACLPDAVFLVTCLLLTVASCL